MKVNEIFESQLIQEAANRSLIVDRQTGKTVKSFSTSDAAFKSPLYDKKKHIVILSSSQRLPQNGYVKVWEPIPVKESLITEGVNVHVMQQTIFDYVLKKLKALNTTFHTSYAQELAKTTDSFWTPQFDNLHDSFNTSTDLDEVEDELKKTIETVSNVICDYFADGMNHPTGYQSRRMQGLDYDAPSQEEVDGLIKKIDPNLRKELENRV
jgi:hypothetical protein